MSSQAKRIPHEVVDAFGTSARAGRAVSPSSLESRVQLNFDSRGQRRRVFDWLGEGLRPNQKGVLPLEYPWVFGPGAESQFFTLWDAEQPVAFCTLGCASYRVDHRPLRTGMISFVYTDPAHRGRGHARRVLEAALARAIELELGLLLLWSQLDTLYAPLGYTRAGVESMLVLDATCLDRALASVAEIHPERPALAIEEPKAGDWSDIERIRSQRTCQLNLAPGDLARARSIPKMSVRVARDAKGVVAFAIRGRGDDFEEVIHEWGGDAHGTLLCCEALTRTSEPWRELLLISPLAPDSVTWALRRAGAKRIKQPLCWMRIASPAALARDLAGLVPELAGIGLSDSLAAQGQDRRIRVSKAQLAVELSQETLLEMLFGSVENSGASATSLQPLAALGLQDAEALPLPFFVWGLESI